MGSEMETQHDSKASKTPKNLRKYFLIFLGVCVLLGVIGLVRGLEWMPCDREFIQKSRPLRQKFWIIVLCTPRETTTRNRRNALDEADLDCMEQFIKVTTNLHCFTNATIAAERENTPIPRDPKCNSIQMRKEQSIFQEFYHMFCNERSNSD